MLRQHINTLTRITYSADLTQMTHIHLNREPNADIIIGLEGKRMGSSEKGKGLAEGRRGRSAEPPEVSVALDVTNERLLILRRSPPLNDGSGGLAKELRSCGRPPSDSRLKDADPQRRAGRRVPCSSSQQLWEDVVPFHHFFIICLRLFKVRQLVNCVAASQ